MLLFILNVERDCVQNYFGLKIIYQIHLIAFQLWDFFTDLNLCYCLFSYYSIYQNDTAYLYFGAICAFFIVFPMWCNVYVLTVTVNKELVAYAPHNERAQDKYNANFIAILICCLITDGNFYIALKMFNSGIFGLDIYDIGLTKSEIQHFVGYKMVYRTLIENVPQLCICICIFICCSHLGMKTVIIVIIVITIVFVDCYCNVRKSNGNSKYYCQ